MPVKKRTKEQPSSQSDDQLLAWMKANGVPITREKYIVLAYGSELEEPWTIEDEADLPLELQDWSLFKLEGGKLTLKR